MIIIIWVLITYSIDLNSNIHLVLYMELVREIMLMQKKKGVAEIIYISLHVPHGRKYSNKLFIVL